MYATVVTRYVQYIRCTYVRTNIFVTIYMRRKVVASHICSNKYISKNILCYDGDSVKSKIDVAQPFTG